MLLRNKISLSTVARWLGDIAVVAAAIGLDLLLWQGDRTLRDGGLIPLWVIPVLVTIVYSILLVRRRYPRAVFIVNWAYGLAGILLPDYVPFAGLLIALFALAHRSSFLWACMGLSVCVVPFSVNAYNVAIGADEPDRLLGFAGTLVLWLALALTVWGSGRLIQATERRAEQEKQEQAAAAVRAERLNLARDLHDIISHSVSAMILQAAGARAYVDRDEDQVRAALKAIEDTGVQAMGELHRLLELLRTAKPSKDNDKLISSPSLHDLDALVSSVRSTGVDVEVVVDGHPAELDPSVGLVAYRVVQEALTNTIKHAGLGASARVHLRWKSTGLEITIRNQAGLGPRGIDKSSSGYGLTGLTERVSLVGGTMEAGLVSDGFLVRVHLPVRPSIPPKKLASPTSESTP